jgi:hypothetical protein
VRLARDRLSELLPRCHPLGSRRPYWCAGRGMPRSGVGRMVAATLAVLRFSGVVRLGLQ